MDSSFRLLMTKVLTNLGLPTKPSDGDVYIISADQRVDVYIGCNKEETLYIFSRLGALAETESNKLDLCKTLLGLNALTRHWTPTVWLSADGEIVAWTRVNLSDMVITNTVTLISKFIDAALQIQAFLDAAPDGSSSLEAPTPFNPGMMKG